MRKSLPRQPPLVPSRIDHVHARELERMGELLDRMPAALTRRVTDEVSEGRSRRVGRPGMSGAQVVRCLVVLQVGRLTYRQLAFHLRDSTTYRRFCGFGFADVPPAHTTLHENIKRVQSATLEKINRWLVVSAVSDGVENADRVRVDSTAIESSIHHPNDSSLLYDSVRALTDRLRRASELTPIAYSNHTKRAKRRALAISNAKSMAERVPLYRDLLQTTAWTLLYAQDAVRVLSRHRTTKEVALANELKHFIGLAQRVFDQTQRRVLGGESVPADEKVVSIFEPHTDIIRKDRRDTYYGHKAFVSVGASGLVLDLQVLRGNPADSTQAVPIMDRHIEIFGHAPDQAAYDGGFASHANLDALKRAGVTDVAFSKRLGLAVEDMTGSEKVYRALQRFRAGVEAAISLLKRCFGFGRCSWRGMASFRAYAWASVLSANLLTYARHTIP